ncbi:MAG TPA: hypothetical protein VFO33_06725 [Casimicrobiaceae bacterium]|nr:hypothetical protein [Casimicrobiaceae bacterium]
MAWAASLAFAAAQLLWCAHAIGGPVEVYRTGPEFCPSDRPQDAPLLSETQIIERARVLLPRDFCRNAFVAGCDADAESAYGAWRVFVRQYRLAGAQHEYAGLDHSYIILDRVGNCLANIPGTELGGRN